MENSKFEILKIAVVGPESTGKSAISAYLADHYHTVWVPEYARDYCAKLTAPPTWQDEINMFNGQLALEQQMLPMANRLLICDTTFVTVKIWSDFTFGRTPREVIEELPRHPYDLYLLLNIDLPWEEDPLRDFPHMREHFMSVWHTELQDLKADYVLIEGLGDVRYKQAKNAVDGYLRKKGLPV